MPDTIQETPTNTGQHEQPNPLQFPTEVMKGSLGRLAHTLAAGTEVPEEFIFAAALTFFGALLDKVSLQGTDTLPQQRLYTVLLGTSTDVKKSTALRKVQDFFDPFFVLSDGGKRLHVMHGVGSAEGLADQFETTPSILLVYDELSTFFGKVRIEGAVILQMVTSLFDKNRWDNRTKHKVLSIQNAKLSLIACCTKDTYEKCWTPDAISIGFPNRLFLVGADRKPKQAWPMQSDQKELDRLRQKIAQQASVTGSLPIDPKAWDMWKVWYDALPGCESAKRLDPIGFRLMPILAATQ